MFDSILIFKRKNVKAAKARIAMMNQARLEKMKLAKQVEDGSDVEVESSNKGMTQSL